MTAAKLYDIYNPTSKTHIVHSSVATLRVEPGARLQKVPLEDHVTRNIVDGDVLKLTPRGEHVLPAPTPAPIVYTAKPKIIIDGMYGIGDNLHQRAAIKELLKTHEVWLMTCHAAIWHDLVGRGLHLHRKTTRLRTQAKILEREADTFPNEPLPKGVETFKIWYNKEQIDKHGTIAGALMAECGVEGKPIDFSMPVPRAWRAEARKLIDTWKPTKPLMIYRPIVRRKEWNGENRNPDPKAYAEIYQAIRDRYFVVSIADLKKDEEWIIGEEQDADIKIHDGSLHFETMAGLFAEADLVFCNAGMAPVLAQSVGTPAIVVYGGRECFRTTQAAGQHLAPTLGIDPIDPCDCQSERHACKKAVDVPVAVGRVKEFIATFPRRKRTLIFGTVYVDSPERDKLTRQWIKLHSELNADCDLLLVDSDSPLKGWRDDCLANGVSVFDFGDNIGHLSRRGRDGWGRAFCRGLQYAIDGGYTYAAHIEGDSLLRTPVVQITRRMHQESKAVASIPVKGMKGAREYPTWVETGLMVFDVSQSALNKIIKAYDWPNRQESPTPEVVLRKIVDPYLLMLDLKGERGDKNQITVGNVVDLDWVTHCHNDIWVYDAFIRSALDKPNNKVKINLGCGENKLVGWENHDADVDITKPLPYPDDHADFIFCEHCVEHIPYVDAVEFFKECHRVLKPGGTVRITVPSIEQIYKKSGPSYWKFATKFGNENSLRGAMANIMYKHGHQTCWTASLLEATMFYAGFDQPEYCRTHESRHPELTDVEGHHHIIGREYNTIESLTYEGTKAIKGTRVMTRDRVAVVCGGGPAVYQEIIMATAMYGVDKCDYFVINDMIGLLHGPAIGVTLHPDKLSGWLQKRKTPLLEIWSHVNKPMVTNVTPDWGGSSGLFAVKVALEKGYERIVLCGVPMTPDNHILRGAPWSDAMKFRKGWEKHINDIKDRVKSFSGWTAELLGRPE